MNAIGISHLWKGALPTLRQRAMIINRLGLVMFIAQSSLPMNL